MWKVTISCPVCREVVIRKSGKGRGPDAAVLITPGVGLFIAGERYTADGSLFCTCGAAVIVIDGKNISVLGDTSINTDNDNAVGIRFG